MADESASPVDVATPVPRPVRRHWMKWALVGVIVAVLAAEFTLAGPYVSKSLGTLRHVDAGWVAFAVLTQVSSMMALTRVQRRMLASGGAHVSVTRMASVVWAANAVNATLPAGSALSWQYGYRRLRKWGATIPAAGFTLLASGVLSALTFGVLLVIGAAGSSLSTLLVSAAALLAVGVPAVILWRRRADGVTAMSLLLGAGSGAIAGAYRVVRRSPEQAVAALEKFVSDLTAIRPRRRDWAIGLALAAMNWIADLVCFLACLAAVDVPKWTLGLALIAFVAGKTASSVTFLPGGLGVVDAAMIVALTAGGVPTAGATAGVVLYRLISLVLIVAIGWLAAAGAWIAERNVVAVVPAQVLPAMAEAVSDVVEAVTPILVREGAV